METAFFIDKQGDPSKASLHSKKCLRIEEICRAQSSTPALIHARSASNKPKKQKNSKDLGKPIKVAPIKPTITDIWNCVTKPTSSSDTVFKAPLVQRTIPEALHPGASYNPSKKHHKEALAMALIREVGRKSNKELFSHAKNTRICLPITPAADLQMPSSGAGQSADNEPLIECQNPTDSSSPSVSRQSQRISQSKKAARRRERECIQNAIRKKELKKLNFQIDNIEKLSSQILLKPKSKREPKKFGKDVKKFEKPIFPVFLNSEIPSSLRAIECSATAPFVDQFKKLQQNRLVEVRVPSLKKRKYSLRKYEKRSYKNFEQAAAVKSLAVGSQP